MPPLKTDAVAATASPAVPSELPIVGLVDHLVYAAYDLEDAVGDLERRLGVRATYGGLHPGGGTHNAVIGLGPGRFLEIFCKDTAQPEPALPRLFGLDRLTEPKLVAWFAKGTNLKALRNRAASYGVPLGSVEDYGRIRPDGVRLSWQFTSPRAILADGLVPPFIDWGTSPHPSTMGAKGVALIDLRAEHPEPAASVEMLAALRLPLQVSRGPRPALVALLDTPNGRIELR